jgi:hypothetical protein
MKEASDVILAVHELLRLGAAEDGREDFSSACARLSSNRPKSTPMEPSSSYVLTETSAIGLSRMNLERIEPRAKKMLKIYTLQLVSRHLSGR